MADHAPVSPIRPEESATTREEMDFDDNEQETGSISPQGQQTPVKLTNAPSPRPRVSFNEHTEDIPPAKPPRPVSPNVQAENTLIEAFPTIDTKVVKAVLAASGGNVEPAFNALLGMSDPDFQAEEAQPPPQPPRPTQRQPMSQLEADEAYARQLAEQYNSGGQRTQNRYNQREPGRRGPNSQRYNDGPGKERSFFDDDLPEIGRNIQEGFLETQKVVNSWITNFKKKIDGDEDEDLYNATPSTSRQNTSEWPQRQNFGPSQSEQLHGIRKSAERTRRSTETQRYDADPHELGADEFERLELRDEEAPPPQPPRTSSRKSANPDLFKSQPKPPQSGPVDEVDAAERRAAGNNASDADKSKKWQPLSSVSPAPEDDNDPFSLGDDDDEKTEDLRKEDSERLKASARDSVSGSATEQTAKPLEETATTSTGHNKEAEELLTGKKS